MQTRYDRRKVIGLGAALVSALGLKPTFAQEYATPSDLQIKDVYTFLILGMDTRPDESELNTDVMMVSRVNLADGTVRTISIPRDLYVEIPGVGYNKINQAFKAAAANGREEWMQGMASTRNTVEHNFGITIDGVLSVRFEGVEKIIDTFGGVTFNNPYDLRDEAFGTNPDGSYVLDYAAGVHEIDGKEALRLMRSRNQDGDDGRVMRQQIILAALLEKAQDPANITKLPELIKTLADTVITDIPNPVKMQLVAAVPSIQQEDLYFENLAPLLWGETLPSGMWVYQGDWTQLPATCRRSWLANSSDRRENDQSGHETGSVCQPFQLVRADRAHRERMPKYATICLCAHRGIAATVVLSNDERYLSA